MRDLLPHHLKLEIGITKIPASRTNHDEQADGNAASDRSDQSRAGSDSPFQQIRAEFNAVGASALGSDRRLHRIDTDLQVP